MTGLSWQAAEYLSEVVLDETAPRSDRLFALGRLLEETGSGRRFLERVAADCRDPFLRRVAHLQTVPARLHREIDAAISIGR